MARAALACGVLSFALACATLAAAIEFRHREWRDPEFSFRLTQLRALKAGAPNRPLVLVLGSSRVQQGIASGAMGFGSTPADPVVFNFGYRGAAPVIAVRNFFRVIEAGVRPDAVLIEFTPAGAAGESSAGNALSKWSNRFTVGDVRLMREGEFLDLRDSKSVWALAQWAVTTAFPWTSHRQLIMSHWLPDWVPDSQRAQVRERMDRYGFTEMRVRTTTTELFQRDPESFRDRFARIMTNTAVPESNERAYSLLIDRCRAESIPVAVVWVPLAPLLSEWVNRDLQRACHQFANSLTREQGVAVFPPPDWLVDDDFADGHHLLPHAAARYSRWLAGEHLRPWLEANGVTSR